MWLKLKDIFISRHFSVNVEQKIRKNPANFRKVTFGSVWCSQVIKTSEVVEGRFKMKFLTLCTLAAAKNLREIPECLADYEPPSEGGGV